MFLENPINDITATSYSYFDQLRATIVITISVAIAMAVLCLILYWIITKSLETTKTIFAAIGIILLLIACIGLEISGLAVAGAWMLIIVILCLNFANMLAYGIATSASSGYIIPILLAMFCLGVGAGYAVTVLGCAIVFVIPILQSRGWIQTILPYRTSNITFDAPTLTIIYFLTAIISGSWVNSVNHLWPK